MFRKHPILREVVGFLDALNRGIGAAVLVAFLFALSWNTFMWTVKKIKVHLPAPTREAVFYPTTTYRMLVHGIEGLKVCGELNERQAPGVWYVEVLEAYESENVVVYIDGVRVVTVPRCKWTNQNIERQSYYDRARVQFPSEIQEKP